MKTRLTSFAFALAAAALGCTPEVGGETADTDPTDPRTTEPQAQRSVDGLIALYSFDEGDGFRVRDTSEFEEPLDLTLGDPSHVVWSGGYMAIGAPTIMRALDEPTKLIDPIKASNEITIELWFQSYDVEQTGAQLVTFSLNEGDRNFAVVQEGPRYDVYLRSAESGAAGIAVSSNADKLESKLTHLVYTRTAGGTGTVWIDGYYEAEGLVNGLLDNWNPEAYVAVANQAPNEDRPWRGGLYRLAVYSRALTGAEVKTNHDAGPE